MPTLLDNIRIRKLENGFTVKYHIALTEHPAGGDSSGQTSERFVANKKELADFVFALISENVA